MRCAAKIAVLWAAGITILRASSSKTFEAMSPQSPPPAKSNLAETNRSRRVEIKPATLLTALSVSFLLVCVMSLWLNNMKEFLTNDFIFVHQNLVNIEHAGQCKPVWLRAAPRAARAKLRATDRATTDLFDGATGATGMVRDGLFTLSVPIGGELNAALAA